jgi:L-rhamnose isomerase
MTQSPADTKVTNIFTVYLGQNHKYRFESWSNRSENIRREVKSQLTAGFGDKRV